MDEKKVDEKRESKESLKKAYFITAYMDPTQLHRLIVALNENSDFFVHIDKKVDETPFRQEITESNVFWIGEREFISWGGISQVYCFRKLFAKMFEQNKQYDRIICLSGTDYPIVSNAELDREFLAHPAKQYVHGYNITRAEIETAKRRCDRHWSMETKIANWYVMAAVRKIKNKLFNCFPMNRQAPLFGERRDVYWGSDYWSVTWDCAQFLYRSLCEEKDFLRYLNACYVPSELAIQTLVFNSPFGEQAVLLTEETDYSFTLATPLQYLEWQGDSIRVLTEADLTALLQCGKMFFRKAYSGVSDELIRRLDERRVCGE